MQPFVPRLLKCREGMEASQCGAPNVEFHLGLAVSSNPLVQCDFFCCVFHVCLVWGFFALKDDLQYGEM